jgi:integrase
MDTIRDIVKFACIRKGTRSTYTSYVNTFNTLCSYLSISPATITETDLCNLCILYCQSHSVTSLTGWLSGIEHFRRSQGLPPLPRHEEYRQVRAGLTKLFGVVDKPRPAPVLSLAEIQALRRSLRLHLYEDALFWCAFVIAFQALLRAGEFTAGHLRLGDITPTSRGLSISIPFSKANPFPVNISIIRRDDWFCPIAALRHLFSFGHAHLTPQSALYPKSYRAFNADLARRCRIAGITKPVTSHSIRRSGATALFDAGVSEAAIMAHGRWISLSWRHYIEFGPSQQLRPTAQLLQAHRR